jgi:ATP-dependent DNA ligase
VLDVWPNAGRRPHPPNTGSLSGDKLSCLCSRLVQACHLPSTELQAEAEAHAKFVVISTGSAYLLRAMNSSLFRPGFIVPAQPVKASKPPVGTDWVREIKHGGYRMIIRHGPSVRLDSRNAYDWTVRLAAIADKELSFRLL